MVVQHPRHSLLNNSPTPLTLKNFDYMKKLIIISLAALVALCACTKNEIAEGAKKEVTFSVATFSGQTKADPADYADNYADIPFGTYAWFYGEEDGAQAQSFMEDETVSYTGSEWKPSLTYYWPKSGSIDFISYSPKSISEYVTVTEESINIGEADKEYIVEHMSAIDVMYADKAVAQTKNIDTYYYNGVPTLFRHALAKINVNVKTAYDKKVMKEGEDETKWAITVTDLAIENYYKKGTVELGLNSSDNIWNLPTDAVWTPAGDLVEKQSFTLPTDATISQTTKPFVQDYFVLPQTLDQDQTIEVTVTIVTTLPNGKTITETGVKLSALMSTDDLKAWQMNKQISYDLTIIPASSDDDGDPVAILFDPAVKDWEDATEEPINFTK